MRHSLPLVPLAAVCLSALGALAACASPDRTTADAATADTARTPPPVTPTDPAAGTPERMTLAVGDTFSVALPSNASTGYSWSVTLPPVLEQEREDYVMPTLPPGESPRPGMGGTMHWRFRAVAAGQGSLDFAYRRPWEENTPPAQTAQYAITVTE